MRTAVKTPLVAAADHESAHESDPRDHEQRNEAAQPPAAP